MNDMGTISLYNTSEYYDEKKERSRTWNKENRSHAREKKKNGMQKAKNHCILIQNGAGALQEGKNIHCF